MITYLGMSMPMAIWSTITWSKNSIENNGSEVKIQKLNQKHILCLILGGTIVTYGLYLILQALETPNIVFSTISNYNKFFAAALDNFAFILLCIRICCK